MSLNFSQFVVSLKARKPHFMLMIVLSVIFLLLTVPFLTLSGNSVSPYTANLQCDYGQHWTAVVMNVTGINPGLSFCSILFTSSNGIKLYGNSPQGFSFNIHIASTKPVKMSFCINNVSQAPTCTDSGSFTGTSKTWTANAPFIQYSITAPNSLNLIRVKISFSSCISSECYN